MEKQKAQNANSRPPIVVILGHVDHGKTTLLDYIRKTNIASREAGGITQSIGATVATTSESKRITFIDTPGHAAFANMRSRGAKVADLAVLVVAGEEGVKPQTQEAYDFIKETGIPFIVAVTKIDLPTASVENVRGELEKLGISFEGRGGDVSLIGVSGRTGKGVDNLLEVIILTAEINGIKGDLDEELEAVVIETGKDKRGLTVAVVLRNGRLEVGQEISAENSLMKVRGIFNFKGESVRQVGPGEPALILGFERIPPVGSKLGNRKNGGEVVERSKSRKQKEVIQTGEGKMSVILKTQSAGSIEAIVSNLPSEIVIIASQVGEVNEGDVFLAKSTGAMILAFEVKVPNIVSKLAETEGVKIETFKIVYELFQKVNELIEGGKVEIKGRAQVLASFPFNGKRIAGCKVMQGKVTRGDVCELTRSEKLIGEMKVQTIKKGKQEVAEVGQGEECGIFFLPQLDFKIGDVILSVLK